MPELPEVESLKRGLEKFLLRRTFLNVEVRNFKIVSGSGTKRNANKNKASQFVENLKNKKITSLKRRAKNIIIELSDKSIIMIHLKMTGQMVYEENKKVKTKNTIVTGGHPIEESYKQDLPHKHTHIIFKLDKGTLYYNDVRQFGYVLHFKNIEEALAQKHFEKIGLEPFDAAFTFEYFRDKILKKNKKIKDVLLEQSVVVGCGNIYADEVCFASGVLPTRNCKTLNNEELRLLHKNIINILSKAIDLGGSSISDYLLADGSRGNYAREHKVYGRAGEKCYTCKNILQKTIVAGRATVFCAKCQK